MPTRRLRRIGGPCLHRGSRDRGEAAAIDEVEQLERGAGRALLAPLPLADEAGGDVQIARKHGLADALARRLGVMLRA